MYNARFENSTNGAVFLLGVNGGNVFDIEGLSGHAVSLGTSQGYGQIGASVVTSSVGAATLTITGQIFTNIAESKKAILKAFAPMSVGRLIVDNYYIYCHVKAAPTVSPQSNSGKFTLQLFAPYPFFRKISENVYTIGGIVPLFSFPTTFNSFVLGDRSTASFHNCVNNGDMPASLDVKAVVAIHTNEITISNLATFSKTRFVGNFMVGDEIHMYRDSDGILRLDVNDVDAFSAMDDSSNLFELDVGYNLIKCDAGEGRADFYITINESVVGVFDGRT